MTDITDERIAELRAECEPREIARSELRAILDRLAAAERERDEARRLLREIGGDALVEYAALHDGLRRRADEIGGES